MHTMGRTRPIRPPLPPALPPTPPGNPVYRVARAVLLSRPASLRHRHVFFVQLGRMLHSGVPVDEALLRIADVVGNSPMGRCARAMAIDVQQGASLSAAMERQPAVFDEVERAIVAALEHTGDLPKAAQRLALRVDEARTQATILRGAVVYPAFLVTTSILSGPLPIAFLQGTSAYLRAIALPFAAWIAVLLVCVRVIPSLLARPQVRTRVLDGLAGLPLTGWMLVNRRYAMLFDVLAQTLDAGLLLSRALELASRATAESRMTVAGKLVALAVDKGATLSAAADGLPGLDSASKATISAGERTGHLPETFADLAKERQTAWQDQLRLFVRALGAVLTIVATVYVGVSIVHQVQQGVGSPLAGLPEADVKELQDVLGKELFK